MASSPFHPELRRAAKLIPRFDFTTRKLRTIRWIQSRIPATVPRGTTVEAIGPISVRLHRPITPGQGPLPALLWIHGGGFVIGDAAQEDTYCRMVADRLGVIVAAVDYRLAPEHPFPIPVDDCHAALVWLAGRDDVDADRVAIGGASAGGGLAASLALVARERGAVRPCFQLLTYPMLDDRTVLRSDVEDRNLRLWSTGSNRFGWRAYLGSEPGSGAVSDIAAPARHDDLTGLPPAWIGVGTLDLFHDEDVAYADRLAAAGVPTDLVIVDGAFHGFDAIPGTRVRTAFWDDQLAALAPALGVEASAATPG